MRYSGDTTASDRYQRNPQAMPAFPGQPTRIHIESLGAYYPGNSINIPEADPSLLLVHCG
jgi:hypothetical protein